MTEEKRKYDKAKIGKNLSRMFEIKGGYYYKYIKYKMKYLKLKNNIK